MFLRCWVAAIVVWEQRSQPAFPQEKIGNEMFHNYEHHDQSLTINHEHHDQLLAWHRQPPSGLWPIDHDQQVHHQSKWTPWWSINILTSSCPIIFINLICDVKFWICYRSKYRYAHAGIKLVGWPWMSKISNRGRFFIFQPFQFFQDMTTLIHKNGCHSYRTMLMQEVPFGGILQNTVSCFFFGN